MSSILYAAIADDDTGASDLAGMFVDRGVSMTMVLGSAEPAEVESWTKGSQGVVFATGTRALTPAEAYEKTASAVGAAAKLSPRTIQIKYCSTFDSTERGNIGPSIDAAMDTLSEPFTIALPALPVNGRTTYCGYHFVKQRLLSDSNMRNHPLTPMTNPDLVDLLSRQTKRSVGLTPYAVVEHGPDEISRHWRELREQGCAISIVDCLSDKHASDLSEAACDMKLITGGSVFGTHLPPAWRRRGWISDDTPEPFGDLVIAEGHGALIVAGSCSVATLAQNKWIGDRGQVVIEIDPVHLLTNGFASEADAAVQSLRQGRTILIKTQSTPSDIARATTWGREQGMEAGTLGLRIAHDLAQCIKGIVQTHRPRVLIIAGGETSTAICRALGIRALSVGRSIEPGVPLCVPVEGLGLPIVLKSGNFGTPEFYDIAIKAADGLR
ncbi:MAG TPA: four-carbon acid sugar kinase family protein [Bryobacteraceae bacterium]|nr:four-carbon acid sugar kinase family protein [Bryobacteraceae bacterium]